MKSVPFLLAFLMLFLTSACSNQLFSSKKSQDTKNKDYYSYLSTQINYSKAQKLGIMKDQTNISKSTCAKSYLKDYSNSYACYVLTDILKKCTSQLDEKEETKIVKIVEKQCI
jgi:hypothetical protein